MRKRRLESWSSKDEGLVVTMVTKGKKEDKYGIDEVLSFVGEVGNKEEKDSRKAKDKKSSKKAEKAQQVKAAGEPSEMFSTFEEVDSLRSENELLKLDWMRLERENCSLRSRLEACEEENEEKLMLEKEQCRELVFKLDMMRKEKSEIEKRLEMTAELWEREQFFGGKLQKQVDALEEELGMMRKEKLEIEKKLEMTAELWEREQFFGGKLQKRVDALEEELQRLKNQSAVRERILEKAEEKIKRGSDIGKSDIGKPKQTKCERDQKLQKMKRHTSAITSRLQAKFKTLKFAKILK